jgi:predicted anti-sigma-YlaC factor YlaD
MTEHVTAWLGAYHDGELQGRRRHQVEAHLAECATCRAELEGLRALSALLQESPVAVDLTSPERFVAQVGLRLPRRPEQPAWQRALEAGWQLAPVGLLGAWTFAHAVFIVAGVVLLVLRLGLVGDLAAWLPYTAPQSTWLTEALSLSDAGLGDVGRVALQLLGRGGPFGWGTMLHLVSLVVIGLLYWSWLASWWARRQHESLELT